MAEDQGPGHDQFVAAFDDFDETLPYSNLYHAGDPRMQLFCLSTHNYQPLASMGVGNNHNDSGYYQPSNSSPYGMMPYHLNISMAQHDQDILSFEHSNDSGQYTERLSAPKKSGFGYEKPEESSSYSRPPYDRLTNAPLQHVGSRGDSMAAQDDGRGGSNTTRQDFQYRLSSSGVAPYGISSSMPAQFGDILGATSTPNPVFDIESDNEEEGLSDYSEDTEDGEWNIDTGGFIVAAEDCNTHTEKPGTIREDNGYLEWLDPKTKRWHRACIHHNIRKSLIEHAQAAHPNREYMFPAKAGKGPYDEISFHSDYQKWGTEREHWPKILFEFDPPKPSQVAKPRIMTFDGMIVLNHQNNPVLDWNIPATLNSTTPACFLEAWKRKFGMSHQDLRARMVRYTFETVNGRTICQALNDKNAVINMPMQRFRDEAGCIAWLKRQDKIRTGLIKLMRSEGVDPEAKNSTKDFGRELTREEQLEVKRGEKSIFLISKSGGKKNPSKTANPEAGHVSAGKSRKRDRGYRDDEVDIFDDGGANHDSGTAPNSRKSFAGQSQNPRPRKSARTSKQVKFDEADKHDMVAHDGDGKADKTSSNFVQKLHANLRAQYKKSNGQNQSRRGMGCCRPIRHLRKRPEYLEQSTDEHSAADHEMSDNDADLDTEMSDSEFEGHNEDGIGEGDDGSPTVQGTEASPPSDGMVAHDETPIHLGLRDYSPSSDTRRDTTPPHLTPVGDSLGPARRLEDYFGACLPHEQDLEVHRATVRQLLGEDCVAEAEVDFGFSPYPYPEGSAVSEQFRYRQGVKKGLATLRNQRREGIRAGKVDYAWKSHHRHGRDTPYVQSLTANVRHQARYPQLGHDVEVQRSDSQDEEGESRDTLAGVAKTDYREVAPANELQCQNIKDALQATREAFFEYTGFPARTTKRTKSYAAQWNRIRSDFEKFDWSEELDGEAPYFPHLPAWHTSLDKVPTHVKDTMYYEAWHRGHRTPIVRLPNGKAFDLPGEFLERIGRYPDAERSVLLDERYRAMGFMLSREEEEQEEEL